MVTSRDNNMFLANLQMQWKEIFQKTLPQAAVSKSSAQQKWPVHVDHCFARIILDNIVGINVPWMLKIQSPAYKYMSEQQLKDSIELGKKIMAGQVDLVVLNEESLDIREKLKGTKKGEPRSGNLDHYSNKRKRAEDEDDILKQRRQRNQQGISPFFTSTKAEKDRNDADKETEGEEKEGFDSFFSQLCKQGEGRDNQKKNGESREHLSSELAQIAASNKTPFQKRVLTLLCQVPRGRYTTYGALSKHLSSSPRAIGNALRNNPFAPMVPCHRVLATGGGIGGFGGSWGRKGEEGKNDAKKRRLLRDDGIRFDGKGRAVGSPWNSFI